MNRTIPIPLLATVALPAMSGGWQAQQAEMTFFVQIRQIHRHAETGALESWTALPRRTCL